MSDLSNKKNLFIDFLKGIGILLVIIGHSIQFADNLFYTNAVYDIIYKFHMPLFFFIGGSNTKEIFRFVDLFHFIKSRINRLLYPFIIWTFIFYSVIKIFTFFGFKILFQFNYAIYWFFPVLFFVSLIFILFKYFYNIKNYFYIFILILLVILLNYLSGFWIKSITHFLFFYILGYIFKNFLDINFKVQFPQLIFLIIFFIILSYIFLNFKFNVLFLFLLKTIFLFNIILLTNYLFYKLSALSLICKLGNVSLEVYILHVFVIFVINSFVDLSTINPLFFTLIILIISILLIFFIKSFPKLNKLFFKYNL